MAKASIFALGLALTIGASGYALADKRGHAPGADWMPADQVRQKLTEAGYKSIKKIKADDGHWEGEGMKNGVKMEFHVDPKTGAIIKEESDDD